MDDLQQLRGLMALLALQDRQLRWLAVTLANLQVEVARNSREIGRRLVKARHIASETGRRTIQALLPLAPILI